MRAFACLLALILSGCGSIHPLVKYAHTSDITRSDDYTLDYIGVGVTVEYRWGSIDVTQGVKARDCDLGGQCATEGGTEVSVRWVGKPRE